MPPIDLTPFGFTQTETAAYDALLELGPATGYAVARHIGIARANAYQALNGLVGKSAATLAGSDPARFRPVRPDGILAHISAIQATRLAELESSVQERAATGDETIVSIVGTRGLTEVLTRWGARSAEEILLVAPQRFLRTLQPMLRMREVDGRTSRVSSSEENDRAREAIGRHAVLFWCAEAAVVADADDTASGTWFSDRVMMATVRAAFERVTS